MTAILIIAAIFLVNAAVAVCAVVVAARADAEHEALRHSIHLSALHRGSAKTSKLRLVR